MTTIPIEKQNTSRRMQWLFVFGDVKKKNVESDKGGEGTGWIQRDAVLKLRGEFFLTTRIP